jgi:hypothetical protein
MSDDRAEWAASALRQFQCSTGTDYDDALPDLLGHLMHWSDRNHVDFDDQLSRARIHYQAETAADDPTLAASAMPPDQPLSLPPISSGAQAPLTTRTYRAEFFTPADYAFRNFEAETPEQALQTARQFYYDDIGELDFRSYDDNASLDQIQIWDSDRGTLASWKSNDYSQRQAAPDLLAALTRILPAYAYLLRAAATDPHNSEAYQQGIAAIAKAQNGAS